MERFPESREFLDQRERRSNARTTAHRRAAPDEPKTVELNRVPCGCYGDHQGGGSTALLMNEDKHDCYRQS